MAEQQHRRLRAASPTSGSRFRHRLFPYTPGGYKRGALRACCGGGGPYNYNMSASCGLPGATTCDDPDAHVSWDGIHLTEAPYRFIANTWLQGPYAHPPIASVLREDMVY